MKGKTDYNNTYPCQSPTKADNCGCTGTLPAIKNVNEKEFLIDVSNIKQYLNAKH